MQDVSKLHHSPHLYIILTFVTTASSLAIFHRLGSEQPWFLVPLLILALLYGVINFIGQFKGRSHFYIDKQICWYALTKRAFARYFIWLCVLYVAQLLYTTAPYYSGGQYQTNRQFFALLLQGYLYFGLPYFLLTLRLKASRHEDFYDPAIRLLHIVKQIGRSLFIKDSVGNPFHVLRNPTNRKVLLNLVMRAYFIPIMLTQVTGNTISTLSLLNNFVLDAYYLRLLIFITMFLWLADIINATLAYCLESRWLENRSRSIDQTWMGWLVCFCCYPPINEATTYLFPFAPLVATGNVNDLLSSGVVVLFIAKVCEVLFLFFHVYSNVSLGPSIANITLKKLQVGGPYGIVRHPGTTTKLAYWLMVSVFYRQFWTARKLYGYVMWGVIYVARAITEERHLKKYQCYQDYMKKVKYRFIPRIF